MGNLSMARACIVTVILALAAACGGNSADPTPSPEVTDTATPSPTGQRSATPTVTPEEEVLEAYFAYWDLYAQAVLNLDESPLVGAASEEDLERVREEIETFREQGVALRVVLQHNPVVLEISESSAIVHDEMINNSFYVDAETLEPPDAPGSGEVLRDTFFLERVDGRWIVVRNVRQN